VWLLRAKFRNLSVNPAEICFDSDAKIVRVSIELFIGPGVMCAFYLKYTPCIPIILISTDCKIRYFID